MTKNSITMKIGFETAGVAQFVQMANSFDSKIEITIGTKIANAKSIMGIISLGMIEGQELIISAEGDDETNAVKELSEYIANLR